MCVLLTACCLRCFEFSARVQCVYNFPKACAHVKCQGCEEFIKDVYLSEGTVGGGQCLHPTWTLQTCGYKYVWGRTMYKEGVSPHHMDANAPLHFNTPITPASS